MNTETASEDNLSASLLEVVEELVDELQLSRGRTLALSLDSSLDKDLGLDSLGWVELIVRIEQRFDIALPQSAFAEIETPRDLLRAISAARGRAEVVPVPEFTGYETERIQSPNLGRGNRGASGAPPCRPCPQVCEA